MGTSYACLTAGLRNENKETLKTLLEKTAVFFLSHSCAEYPTGEEFEQILQDRGPSVVFIGLRDLHQAFRLALTAMSHSPGTHLVAVHEECDKETLIRLVRAGVHEFLRLPLAEDELRGALARLSERLRLNPPEQTYTPHVFAFLPAKPGAGSTTVAMNVSHALVHRHGLRVALLDFDLSCGVLDFMMKLPFGYTIQDAAQYASRLDSTIWLKLITQLGNLHFLRSGGNGDEIHLTPAQAQDLLNYSRRHYDAVCVDLSGEMEAFSRPILERCNQVIVVTSNRIASLHLAKRKLSQLERMGLRERVHVVVNQYRSSRPVQSEHIRGILNSKVLAIVPEDDGAIRTALLSGKPVDVDSKAGAKFVSIASRLIGKSAKEKERTRKHLFLNRLPRFFTRKDAVRTGRHPL